MCPAAYLARPFFDCAGGEGPQRHAEVMAQLRDTVVLVSWDLPALALYTIRWEFPWLICFFAVPFWLWLGYYLKQRCQRRGVLPKTIAKRHVKVQSQTTYGSRTADDWRPNRHSPVNDFSGSHSCDGYVYH